MQLQPLEKQLDLPPVLVELCYGFCADIQRICEEDQLSSGLFVPVDDAPEFSRILLSSHGVVHMTPGVGKDAGVLPKTTLPKLRLEVIVLLAADDEVGSDALNIGKTLEVVVTTVEDVVVAPQKSL